MIKAIFRAGVTATLLSAVFICNVQRTSAQIAPGVLQSAAHTATVTGTVTQPDGTLVPGADVKLTGPAVLTTKTDAHGTFAFTAVPWGTYQVVVTSSIGTASRNNVVVNGDVTVAIQYQQQSNLKQIARVSTMSAGANINVSSSAITSISPGDFAFQGNTSWAQLLAQVPGVTPSGFTQGGCAAFLTVAGAPQAPVVLSLNGSLPYETSTTLDGMPIQNAGSGLFDGGGVDLSNMPLNAFDTADIVRGPGANAPSIVDSIGGSFVLHPAGEVNATHYEFSISNDAYGGIVSNAKVALHLGRLSATFVYGVNDSPGPLGNTAQMPSTFQPGTINGQYVEGSVSTFGTPSPPNIPFNCNCAVTDSLLTCCVPSTTAWTQHGGAASLLYNVTPNVTAQVFYAGNVSNQNYLFGYFPTEFSPDTSAGYTGSIAPSPPGVANYRFMDVGFLSNLLSSQSSSLLEEKINAFIGRGVLRLAALQNYSSYHQPAFLDGYAPGTYKLWGTACLTPNPVTTPCTQTAFNGTAATVGLAGPGLVDALSSWANNRDLLASYAQQIGSSTSLGLSFVDSYYNDPLLNSLSFSSGGTLFSDNQSTAISDTTTEWRLNLQTAIGDKLSVGLSYYVTNGHYHVPLSGNTEPNDWTDKNFPYSAPRIGIVWQANSNIAIRGSAGGGFALPQLNNLVGSPPLFVGSYYSGNSANPNLHPEESFGYDVGADMRFHHDTVLSMDLYQTNLFGQFFSVNNLVGYNGGLPVYLYGTGNLANSRMEGLNLDLHHQAGNSGYYWRTTFALTRGYITAEPAGFYNNATLPCTNCTNQGIVLGPNFTTVSGEAATVPYSSGSAQLGYQWQPGRSLDLVGTYYGNNNVYDVPAFVEVNGHLTYGLTKHLSIYATFQNITGIYDQAIVTLTPAYAVPVISGAQPPYPYQGAAFDVPYGPRSTIVTLNFH